jgi:hypothetical protein
MSIPLQQSKTKSLPINIGHRADAFSFTTGIYSGMLMQRPERHQSNGRRLEWDFES